MLKGSWRDHERHRHRNIHSELRSGCVGLSAGLPIRTSPFRASTQDSYVTLTMFSFPYLQLITDSIYFDLPTLNRHFQRGASLAAPPCREIEAELGACRSLAVEGCRVILPSACFIPLPGDCLICRNTTGEFSFEALLVVSGLLPLVCPILPNERCQLTDTVVGQFN
jgi:hypothetical protein